MKGNMFYIKFKSGKVSQVWKTPFKTREEATNEIVYFIRFYGYKIDELSVIEVEDGC